ncbi:MAG: hypothetical protein COA78_08325 [Blastopirellula sp.]|nr:MAG: hypothetical protein COA78_08325 [Blastopirellula sp.]
MAPTWLLVVLSVIGPFIVYFSLCPILEYWLTYERYPKTIRVLLYIGLSPALTIPSVSLYLADWLSLPVLGILLCSTLVLFLLALGIHNGNVLESFLAVALITIVLCHFVSSAGFAYEGYQHRLDNQEIPKTNISETHIPILN